MVIEVKEKYEKTWQGKMIQYAMQRKEMAKIMTEMEAALSEEDCDATGMELDIYLFIPFMWSSRYIAFSQHFVLSFVRTHFHSIYICVHNLNVQAQ